MKKIFLSILFFQLAICYGQPVPTDSTYVCGYTESFLSNTIKTSPISSKSLMDIIEKNFKLLFKTYMGCDENSIHLEEVTNNQANGWKYAAAEARYINEQIGYARYIMFDSNTLNNEFLNLGSGWVLRCILLHEIGHHFNFNTLRVKAKEQSELDADYFSGLTMGRLKLMGVQGLDTNTAFLAIKMLSNDKPKDGYPAKQDRLKSIRTGWVNGNLPISFSPLYAIASTIQQKVDKQKISKSFLDHQLYYASMDIFPSKAIKADSTIKSDILKTKFYFKDKVLMYEMGDKNILEIGQLASSDRKGFKNMIYDKYLVFWHIKEDGKIYYIENDTEVYIGKLSD